MANKISRARRSLLFVDWYKLSSDADRFDYLTRLYTFRYRRGCLRARHDNNIIYGGNPTTTFVKKERKNIRFSSRTCRGGGGGGEGELVYRTTRAAVQYVTYFCTLKYTIYILSRRAQTIRRFLARRRAAKDNK